MDKFLMILPSGELRWVELSSGRRRLDELHQLIGCDCVEQVFTVIPGICIVIDGDGKVKYPPQPHNELASRLYYGYHVGAYNIVGPAVVFALRRTGPYQELDWFPLEPRELAQLSLCLGVKLPDK